MCPHCRAFVPASESVCTECHLEMGRSYAARMASGAALAGLVQPTHFTTLIILLINAALFAAVLILSIKKGGGEASWSIDNYILYYFGAKESGSILAGQWWRLITAGFLHGGVLHILMNSWALYDLGAQVEQAYGTARFLALYLVSSAAGFLASTYWSNTLSIGASAALFGLIGAMIAFGYRHRGSLLGVEMRSIYTRWVIYGLLFSLMPGIDLAAHVGGLAAGCAVGFVAGEPGGPRPIDWLWRVAAAFALLITAVAFAFVWLTYPGGAR